MKTITIRQLAAIKRVAQNVNGLVQKRDKIAKQIVALNKEYNDLAMEIEGHEMGVINLTGYTSDAFVTKVSTPGKPSKYEIVKNTLQYDPEKKVYNILLGEDVSLDNVTPNEVDTPEEDLFAPGQVSLDEPNTQMQDGPFSEFQSQVSQEDNTSHENV